MKGDQNLPRFYIQEPSSMYGCMDGWMEEQNLTRHHWQQSFLYCGFYMSRRTERDQRQYLLHVGLLETYRYKRTGQFFIWNYIGNWYVFSKYLDNYCRYQYCANDTLFRNISSILRSIFQDILQNKDVAFCETTDTAHSYIKQIVNFSEINVPIDA